MAPTATAEEKVTIESLKGKSTTELVQGTWRLVEQDLDAHGIKFFMRIFEIAPPALQLFSFKNEVPLEESPGMKKHAASVMRTVGAAVAGLSDLAALVPVLQALGTRHDAYGVQPAHFAIVGEALLWTLEQGLGELWTEDVKNAWAGTYGTVQSVMEAALIEATQAAPNN
mmetsp:Transcript_1720/g.3029  ORF Transcript_1720/g.3029 Transcript_1720/m.3029 type:complete len:170 (+) Transcript_1720:20-529(+)